MSKNTLMEMNLTSQSYKWVHWIYKSQAELPQCKSEEDVLMDVTMRRPPEGVDVKLDVSVEMKTSVDLRWSWSRQVQWPSSNGVLVPSRGRA